jgi:hypothetical protein
MRSRVVILVLSLVSFLFIYFSLNALTPKDDSMRKSKSKLRVNTQLASVPLDLDSHEINDNIPDYKREDKLHLRASDHLGAEEDSHKRSTAELQKQRELSKSSALRVSKSHDSFHVIEVPTLPPPPQPFTPRASAALVSSGIMPRPTQASLSSSAIVIPHEPVTPTRVGSPTGDDSDFVYVD